MDKKGKKQSGRYFLIWEENQQPIYKLLLYFIHDQENANYLVINLYKGILLTNPVSCGNMKANHSALALKFRK